MNEHQEANTIDYASAARFLGLVKNSPLSTSFISSQPMSPTYLLSSPTMQPFPGPLERNSEEETMYIPLLHLVSITLVRLKSA
jgi:hypothetical protein